MSGTWAEVTQRLGVLNGSLWVASPCGLASSQYGGWRVVLLLHAGSGFQPQGPQGRSCIAFYDTTLQATQHTLSVKAITSLPRCKGRGIGLYLSTGNVPRLHCRWLCGTGDTAAVIWEKYYLLSSTSSHISSHPPCVKTTLISSLKTFTVASTCNLAAYYRNQVVWIRLLRRTSLSTVPKLAFL